MSWMRGRRRELVWKNTQNTRAPSARKRIKYFQSTTALLLCVNCRYYVWCFLFRQSLWTASLKPCTHYAYRYIEKQQTKKMKLTREKKSGVQARFRWNKCRLCCCPCQNVIINSFTQHKLTSVVVLALFLFMLLRYFDIRQSKIYHFTDGHYKICLSSL